MSRSLRRNRQYNSHSAICYTAPLMVNVGGSCVHETEELPRGTGGRRNDRRRFGGGGAHAAPSRSAVRLCRKLDGRSRRPGDRRWGRSDRRRRCNTAADLSRTFSDLRRRNFDLYGAALLAPQLTAAPALDADKRLRLTGFFATRPLRIKFDLSFQAVSGQWRLFHIAITTPPAPPLAAQAQAPDAKKNAPAPTK